tara:strand:+ start:3044 stop:4519 length:1476 start_codon:yes stop_codon:yes gene_type:complete
MAIAEFGRSLLGDVRARKDQQADDARKYAKKQEKKELLLAGTAFLGGQIFKAASSNLQAKTNAFLSNSELYNNKLKVQKAGSLITEAQGYRNTAEEANISIYDQFLQETATAAATQQQIAKPNSFKAGEIEEYASVLAERDEIKALARDKTTYWESILEKADAYKVGTSKTTLESLAAIQQPKTVVGSMWNKITGEDNTVTLFNAQMSRLEQVVAATEIEKLTLNKKKKMAETLLRTGGGLSLAKVMVGYDLTKAEQEKYKAYLKAGQTTKELKQEVQVSSRGVYVTTYTEVTEQNGNVGVVQETKQQFGPDDVLDSADIASLTGNIDNLMDTVAENFNEKGMQDFALAMQRLVNAKPKDEKLNTDDVLDIYMLALQPDKFTERKNITRPLSPQAQAALIERSGDLSKTIRSELQTIIDSKDLRDVEKTAELMNLVNSFTSQTLEAIRNPENVTDVDKRNDLRIDSLQAANPKMSREEAVDYLKIKGTWND